MPSINIPQRFVFDKYFYDEIRYKKIILKPPVLTRLMYINDKSVNYRRRQNVMSKKDFDLILNESKSMVREVLRTSFYDLSVEEIEVINDDFERVIKLAIDLLEESPHKTIIFTSEDKKQVYKENPHFINDISVKSGKEALAIIDEYFSKCQLR